MADNTTKATAYDVANLPSIGTGIHEIDQVIGYGIPPTITYDTLWYKMFIPLTFSNMYCVTVWNMGGPYYAPSPPDDEWVQPPDAKPGAAYPCIVTVYDASDVVIVTGKHVQFSTNGRKNTWIYFKVEQPAPHFPNGIVCYAKFRVGMAGGEAIRIGTIFVQDEQANGVVMAMPAGYAGYNNPRNIVFPEDAHSVSGGSGDVLSSGVNCIIDHYGNCVTVRDKNYRNPIFVPNIGTTVYNIRRNADGLSNFWISYTTGGMNKVAPINIVHNASNNLVSATLGPALGITSIVDRLCARSNQILYYVTQGSSTVKRWNIIDNIAMEDLVGNPNLGTITDLLVLPDGSVVVGYNKQIDPPIADTRYTIRRYDGITGTHVRDYVFDSQGQYNRINYGDDANHLYLWTHELSGESTFRKVRLVDGVVIWRIVNREFNTSGKLIIDNELYQADGSQGNPAQFFGAGARFNFWVSQVVAQPSGYTSNGGGLIGITPTQLPDDEYYPPIIAFPPLPGTSVPEIPSYPGYPWLPPPPGAIPPGTLPTELKIGGGLIILDPDNMTRHDAYLDHQGQPIQVPIKVSIRTAFLGD